MRFPNRSDTNRPAQSQKRARSLKFWSSVEEELYYPSSENKGADQLRGYREADLSLCFRNVDSVGFPMRRLINMACLFVSYGVDCLVINASDVGSRGRRIEIIKRP